MVVETIPDFEEEKWSILNLNYCGLTPRAVLIGNEQTFYRLDPKIAGDAFVSAYWNTEDDGVYLTVVPFQTESEPCKEIQKFIGPLDNEWGMSLDYSRFYSFSASKALIDIAFVEYNQYDQKKLILLDFNI